MNVTTYVMRANGITVTFDDNTVAEGEFFSGPSGFKLIGLTPAQTQAVYTYLAAVTWDKDIDPRLKDDGTGGTGTPGPSAYDVAVSNGFVGTEPQWLLSLVGPPGPVGPQGPPGILSGSTIPQILDNLNPVGARGQINVKVVAGYAFVTSVTDNGLGIFDVSNPNDIRFLSSINGSGAPNFLGVAIDVEIVGDLAYVTSATNAAVTIIDISNKISPQHVFSIVNPIQLAGVQQIKVRGRYAYVAAENNNTVAILDIFDGIRIANQLGGPTLASPRGLEIAGDRLYVVARNSAALSVFDISTPDNPVLMGSLSGFGNSLGQCVDVKVKNGIAFVSCLGFGSNCVTAINVTDPGAIFVVGVIPASVTQNNCIQTSIAGNVLYILSVNDSAITLVDITDVTLFGPGQIIGYLSDPVNMNAVQGIFVDGTVAYTASFGAGLSTYRVMGFTSPGMDVGNAAATNVNVEQNVLVGRDIKAVGYISGGGIKSETDLIANREVKSRYLYTDFSYNQCGQFSAVGGSGLINGNGLCGSLAISAPSAFSGFAIDGAYSTLFSTNAGENVGLTTGNIVSNLTNGRLLVKFSLQDWNNVRFFCGAATNGLNNVVLNDSPIGTNLVGVSYSTSNGDAEFQYLSINGLTITRTPTGNSIGPVANQVYYIEIDSPIGSDGWNVRLMNESFTLLDESLLDLSVPQGITDVCSLVCGFQNLASVGNGINIFTGYAINRFS